LGQREKTCERYWTADLPSTAECLQTATVCDITNR